MFWVFLFELGDKPTRSIQFVVCLTSDFYNPTPISNTDVYARPN